jgi:hypothetical protein
MTAAVSNFGHLIFQPLDWRSLDILNEPAFEFAIYDTSTLFICNRNENENGYISNMNMQTSTDKGEGDVNAAGQDEEVAVINSTADQAMQHTGFDSDGEYDNANDIQHHAPASDMEGERQDGLLPAAATDAEGGIEGGGEGEEGSPDVKETEGQEGTSDKDQIDTEGAVDPQATATDDVHGERNTEDVILDTDRQHKASDEKDRDRGRSSSDRRDSRDRSKGGKRSREPIPTFDSSDVKRNRPRSPLPPRSRGAIHNSRQLSPPRRLTGPDSRGMNRRSPHLARNRKPDSRGPAPSRGRREEPSLPSPRRRSISPPR